MTGDIPKTSPAAAAVLTVMIPVFIMFSIFPFISLSSFILAVTILLSVLIIPFIPLPSFIFTVTIPLSVLIIPFIFRPSFIFAVLREISILLRSELRCKAGAIIYSCDRTESAYPLILSRSYTVYCLFFSKKSGSSTWYVLQ